MTNIYQRQKVNLSDFWKLIYANNRDAQNDPDALWTVLLLSILKEFRYNGGHGWNLQEVNFNFCAFFSLINFSALYKAA